MSKTKCHDFKSFIEAGGLEYMKKSFDSLLSYEDKETRELFFEEIQSSLETGDPRAVMKLMKGMQEVVAATGYHLHVSTHVRFGKKSTRFAIPPLENYIIECVKAGTLDVEDIRTEIEKNIDDKELSESIIGRLALKIGQNL